MWEDQELHSKAIIEIDEQDTNFYSKKYPENICKKGLSNNQTPKPSKQKSQSNNKTKKYAQLRGL